VDDDPIARTLARKTLQADGYPVVEAKDGRAALDFLMASPTSEPRLILLDLEMPGMSGWEFLAVVKSYARLSAIPVVVVSGAEPHSGASETEAVAARIRKPCAPAELVAVVEKHARRVE
jgi:CheY-like chemotaxis protein